MQVTNATRDQVVVAQKICTTTRRLLAQSVIGILITLSDGAVKPADIALTKDKFKVIGEAVVAVIYEAEAVQSEPENWPRCPNAVLYCSCAAPILCSVLCVATPSLLFVSC
jgi:hypothetical protein